MYLEQEQETVRGLLPSELINRGATAEPIRAGGGIIIQNFARGIVLTKYKVPPVYFVLKDIMFVLLTRSLQKK